MVKHPSPVDACHAYRGLEVTATTVTATVTATVAAAVTAAIIATVKGVG